MLHDILDKFVFSWVESSKIKHIFSEKNKPDVILTDKNDIAVALKYDFDLMDAPIVLEKGRNTYAHKLIDTGNKYKIPIVEDKELVNELFSSLGTGQTVLYNNYNKIAKIYAKYTKINIAKEKNNKYFDEIFETQRLQEQEILSIHIPEKICIEISSNIYSILMNKYFNIDIYGFKLSNIKTNENKLLNSDEYNIKINGLLIKSGKIKYTFIEPFEQLNIYLTECLKRHYKQLIGRDEIVYFLSQIKEKYPILINEILKYYTVGEIKKVIHDLLDESVPINNIITILETMTDFGSGKHNFDIILENIRKVIGRDICFPYLNDNVLKVITFEPNFEKTINENVVNTENGKMFNDEYSKIVQSSILNTIEKLDKNKKPILLYEQTNRKLIKKIAENINNEIVVISASEIPKEIQVELVLEIKEKKYNK